MKKGIIILVVIGIVGLILTVIIVGWQKRKTATANASLMTASAQAQANAAAANTQAMENCKNNWLCATSQVLGGVGDLGSSIAPIVGSGLF